MSKNIINTLNAELNSICHLLVLLDHPILHSNRIKVKFSLTYTLINNELHQKNV